MPIDYFSKSCNNQRKGCDTERIQCLDIIADQEFGITDVEGGNNLPAKVVINPNRETDFMVNNRSNIPVMFKAVDWCIPIYRTGAYNLDDEDRDTSLFSSNNTGIDPIKRCEGFLQFNNSIHFIEIKNRGRRGNWLKDAREKFEETILSFREHHPALAHQIAKPILCNPTYTGFHQNEMVQKRILKDKIGVEFVRQNEITI